MRKPKHKKEEHSVIHCVVLKKKKKITHLLHCDNSDIKNCNSLYFMEDTLLMTKLYVLIKKRKILFSPPHTSTTLSYLCFSQAQLNHLH